MKTEYAARRKLLVLLFAVNGRMTAAQKAVLIEKAIRKAYPKGIGSIRKEELVTAVKKYFHCSAKEAHYILGVARRKKLVDIAAEYVTIMF